MTTLELIEKHGIGHNCLSDAYELGREDVLKDIAKIIDDYACDRDVKSNVSLGEMISKYIYEQTKEQKNG